MIPRVEKYETFLQALRRLIVGQGPAMTRAEYVATCYGATLEEIRFRAKQADERRKTMRVVKP